jgi:NADPH2:quinone reductase
MADTIRAARLHRHGDPLVVEAVPLPTPEPGEVRVQLAYAGVNPVDRYGAAGRVAADGPLPRTLGTEAAGTVDGRPVVVHGHGLGTTRDGLWATAAVVPKAALVAVPDGVGLDQAAAMGVAGVTAWRTAVELAQVGAEDRVLVLGASGGVGSMLVSICHHAGATVVGQTGDPAKAPWVRARGADEVVTGNAEAVAATIRRLAPTVVFDALGDGFTGMAVDAMARRGRLVLFGTSAGASGEVPLQPLYRKGLTVLGYGGLIEPEDRLGAGIAAALDALARGVLQVEIGERVPLEDINRGLQRQAERRVLGKLVVDLAPTVG